MKTSEFMLNLTIAVLMMTILTSCTSVKTQINAENGIAIKGYDTVAYFTEGRPVKGREEFAFEWKGAKWLFSSMENMELFEKAPERYAPQYGGY